MSEDVEDGLATAEHVVITLLRVRGIWRSHQSYRGEVHSAEDEIGGDIGLQHIPPSLTVHRRWQCPTR